MKTFVKFPIKQPSNHLIASIINASKFDTSRYQFLISQVLKISRQDSLKTVDRKFPWTIA